MIDSTLTELRTMRDRLRQKLEATADFVEWQAVDTAIRQIEASRSSQMAATPAPLAKLPDGANGRKLSQTDLAILVVTRKGRPLPTSAIIPEILAMGGTVGGNNPLTSLSSVLSKSTRVESVSWQGSKGWWPKGVPLPDTSPESARPG